MLIYFMCINILFNFATKGKGMKENVSHPSHYKKEGRKECIEEMVDLFGEQAVCIWCALNHYKYNYRKGDKEGNSEEQDIKKGKWYMDYIKKFGDKVFFIVPLSVWRYIQENRDYGKD